MTSEKRLCKKDGGRKQSLHRGKKKLKKKTKRWESISDEKTRIVHRTALVKMVWEKGTRDHKKRKI